MSKRRGGAAVEPALDVIRGSAPVGATTAGAASAANVFKPPLGSDKSFPPEMMSQRFRTEPLAQQLSSFVKIRHVSVGYPGIVGSFVRADLDEKSLVLLKDVASIEGVVRAVNATKTEKMRGIIKDQAKKYVKKMGWLHGIKPEAFEQPVEATYECRHLFFLSDDDCALLSSAVKGDADELNWAANYSIRVLTAVRINQLHNLVQSKGKRGGGGVGTTAAGVLASSPLKELHAAARENMEEKYGRVD